MCSILFPWLSQRNNKEKAVVPSERLRVFISSAQSNEGGFAWSKVRRRIKDYLGECPYLNPFIIEDISSATPSTQLFQRQVERADVVVVLVKGEVRSGTAIEYTLAIKLKKPLLVYFLADDNPDDSVAQLKRDLQQGDYCTYHKKESFDSVEVDIRNEIIEDVIRYYQDMPLHRENETPTADTVVAPIEVEPARASVPNKTAISMFKSCYDHIYDGLGIGYIKDKEPQTASTHHDFGVAAIDWLVTGTPVDWVNDVSALMASVHDLYGDTRWLQKRWDAIKQALLDNIEDALVAEKEALALAKEANVATWIVNDILIDCRNLEGEINQTKRHLPFITDAQKELDKSETIIYLPILDRYLENAYESTMAEEVRIKTAPHGTQFLGTNIKSVIGNVENYYFSALLYGSYTHMHMARKALANVLYKYGEITDDSDLYLAYTKLLALYGVTKTFRQNLQHNWDRIYSSITSDADKFWGLSKVVSIVHRDAMKLEIIGELGLYFSDEAFHEAENYLDSFADNVYWGNSEAYFKCILQNMSRLSSVKILKMISGIIQDQRFHLGSTISRILLNLHLEDVDQTLQWELCEGLKKQLPLIVSNNGTPQIIAALEAQNPTIFSALRDIPDNGLVGTEKILYEINVGRGNWTEILLAEIDTARCQFEANQEPGKYVEFFEKPYSMIKQVIREHYEPGMDSILVERFFPLCTQILTSDTETKIKSDCIDCLCDVFVFAINEDVDISPEMAKAISSVRATHNMSLLGDSKEIFACRILMLRLIIGQARKDELLEWCFGYSKKNNSEKIALAECIEQYLRKSDIPKDDVDTMIVSIVLQCFEDNYYAVRQRACLCMTHMINSKYRSLIVQKLHEAAMDPSHYVRNYILRLCKKGLIKDATITEALMGILQKDANYTIRTSCK